MANVNFWHMPLSGRKTQIQSASLDEATASIANACPAGSVAIFCNDAVFTDKGLISNIGQDAIDALRDGLIERSEIYTSMLVTDSYYSSAKFNNPKPLSKAEIVIDAGSTLIVTIDPNFQVGIIVNQPSPRTTGLAFTALGRVRDYIQEKG